MFNSDNAKIGTARRQLCSLLSDKVNCYSFEVSIFGYKLKGTDVVIPYTEESCILFLQLFTKLILAKIQS